jgi:hypothetical protein
MIARVCPEQQTIRKASEEPEMHSSRDVRLDTTAIQPETQRNIFATVRMCGVACALFARVWNLCVGFRNGYSKPGKA